MNNQRLTIVNVFIAANEVVYSVSSGTSDSYTIQGSLNAFSGAREKLERFGMTAITPNKKQYMVILPEESPYFNLGVLVKSIEKNLNENSTQAILQIGNHLYNLLKKQEREANNKLEKGIRYSIIVEEDDEGDRIIYAKSIVPTEEELNIYSRPAKPSRPIYAAEDPLSMENYYGDCVFKKELNGLQLYTREGENLIFVPETHPIFNFYMLNSFNPYNLDEIIEISQELQESINTVLIRDYIAPLLS